VNLSNARLFGNRVDSMRENRDLWMEHAKKKESQLEQLQREYQALSDKHVRLSQRYETLDTMLGWLQDGPSVEAISAIHKIKATHLNWMANDKAWMPARRREENIKLMAEAEYDYHVLADPSYRLKNASIAFSKIADYAEDPQTSEKIKNLVRKMEKTSTAREDDHREKFLEARIKQLTESIQWEDSYSCIPVIDSIPPAVQLDETAETNDGWKIIKNKDEAKSFLIQNNRPK